MSDRPTRCERCFKQRETALCLGCWRYCCQACFGEHVCEECERTLSSCGCRGKGCLNLIEAEPQLEVHG